MSEGETLDPTRVLDNLKDFQRRTANYVFRRLYVDSKPAKRFLIADEVGLGKTLVARGLIAKAIRELGDRGVERIDVVYICSNADIARQNINRLQVGGDEAFNLPTRITLLPLRLHELKTRGVNFISFTPGTSFDLRSRSGIAEERALLYWLLRYVWGWRRRTHVGVFRVLQGYSRTVGAFRRVVESTSSQVGNGDGCIDRGLAEAFKRELLKEDESRRAKGEPSLREHFEELAERYHRTKRDVDWEGRQQLVGELRYLLARSCVEALQPDLVILDEFQRFRSLLDGDDEAATLAQRLFEQDAARVVLLSATPYKMYTLPEESEASDDHYIDFNRTTKFLMGEKDAGRFQGELREFRKALTQPDLSDAARQLARNRVERRLRRVMVRTERLAVQADRNGMVVERPHKELRLETDDLHAYLVADLVGRRLGSGDGLEYWKSSPYLLNFMETYKLKRSFRDALLDSGLQAELAGMLVQGDGLLPMEKIESYQKLDPGNARLRALMEDTLDNDAWKLLWLPASLPYYQPEPPYDAPHLAAFTKRLVFSAWWVVPQVISTLVSYEAERRMIRSSGRNLRNTAAARRRLRPLLRFQRRADRVSGMPLLALTYPSPSLATLADPVQSVAVKRASSLPSMDQVIGPAERRIARALRSILPRRRGSAPVDERWYWAAPLLLDYQEAPALTAEWLAHEGNTNVWAGDDVTAPEDTDSALIDALTAARGVIDDPSQLGTVPDDLARVLARLAVGGPGICALRALARAAGGLGRVWEPALRDGAAHCAWGFRSLFNTSEVIVMVRGTGSQSDDAYWQKVLDYCLRGNLQAVLDEYVHVLRESEGLFERDPAKIGDQLGDTLYEALTLRAATPQVEEVRLTGPASLELNRKTLRTRYAVRFGAQDQDESGNVQRASQVRTAFNSPFWPFVLATTSVGQEGLDFHLYCHAVVHWNLPGNPVDLEQREGRVHRYKGHAIRKNVASAHRPAAFRARGGDPWERMFEAAKQVRSREYGDLVPYWITPNGEAKIERYVPALPLSSEIVKLEQLKRSLAVYRLAFGQPRQDDLTSYLSGLPEDRREAVAGLRIDLRPR